MAKMRVTCEIDTYSDTAKPSIRIHSHWNQQNYVEIEIGGERYTVDGNELKTAVTNCMNNYTKVFGGIC